MAGFATGRVQRLRLKLGFVAFCALIGTEALLLLKKHQRRQHQVTREGCLRQRKFLASLASLLSTLCQLAGSIEAAPEQNLKHTARAMNPLPRGAS